MRVICAEDCGNAPRKEILRDLAVARAEGAFDIVMAQAADDIVWDVVGDERVIGKEALAEALTAALDATVTYEDGRRLAYCDVYVFASAGKTAKIKEITTYVRAVG